MGGWRPPGRVSWWHGSILLALRKAGIDMLPSSKAIPAYTSEEWHSLRRLRDRCQENRDLWTERELAHLRFVRWLAQTGRL
ncbi:MAG: hypothetical protein ACLQUY_04715 [Ktedonobacterales bacterium]